MYNRILKRPMFKRGGSSYEAQGTGITSPYDTPRKRYALGSWEDWEEQTRKATKDPRGDWSYAAQGFSSLANPYKESGEAKTIGEMLYAGAQGVRGSREKATELERKGEIAILESQGGRMLAEEKHKRDVELAELKIKATEEELKRIPLARLITDIAKSDTDLKNAVPGSFQFLFVSGIATGRAIQRRKAADNIAVGVLETHRWAKDPKTGWDYNADNLNASIPWFDPVKQQWHVFNADGDGMATGDPVKSFLTVDEAIAYLKGGNQEIIKEDETLEENNANQTEKKVVEKGTTQEEMEASAKKGWEEMKKGVQERFTLKGDITQGVNPYKPEETLLTDNISFNKGGRVGYATGDAVDPLDDLKAWWKEQAWNNEG